MKVERLESLIAKLRDRAAASRKDDDASVSVGYTQNYAVFVHENMEAHHVVGPVDERQAEGQQGGEQAAEHAEGPRPGPGGEHDELEGDDQQRRHERAQRSEPRREGRHSGAAHARRSTPSTHRMPARIPWPAKVLAP